MGGWRRLLALKRRRKRFRGCGMRGGCWKLFFHRFRYPKVLPLCTVLLTSPMKVLLILAALTLFAVYAIAAPLPSQQPESSEFLDFVSKYDRVYGNPEERALRSRIFERNLAKIRSINSNPNYTWTAGVNHLADRSNDEMANLKGYSRSMARSLMASSSIGPQVVPRLSPSQLPASVDWRDKGVVTPVKNQGGCGSCWAFSTAETMESAVAIASGQLLEFSEQQLVDCAPNPNHCGGTVSLFLLPKLFQLSTLNPTLNPKPSTLSPKP